MKLLSFLLIFVSLAAAQAPRRSGAPPLRAQQRQGALKPGDAAPDFSLKIRGGEQTIRLSSFRGKKPVALVFGSYT